MSTTTPDQPKIDPERSAAAAVLGRKGGSAGKGKSKVRSKKAIQKAVKARIAAVRARKAQATAA